MKKTSLGQVLKQRRHFLALTQRELAAKVGVKASHIAYLENERRRPSLSLLTRLADTLGLDKEPLLLMAHPEAKALLSPRRGDHAARKAENPWRRFISDRGLHARYQVKPQELEILRRVNLLGKISSPRQFLFILNSIRQAVDQEV